MGKPDELMANRGDYPGCPPLFIPPNSFPKPWGFWMTLVFTFLILSVLISVGTLVFWAVGYYYYGSVNVNLESTPYYGFSFVLSVIFSAPLCLLLIFFLVRMRNIPVKDYLALGRFSLKNLVSWMVIMLVVMMISDLFLAITSDSVSDFQIKIYRTARSLPVFYLAVVFISPLFEEIFFRGFMFTGFQNSRLGAEGTIILVSLLWSILHLQYDVAQIAVIFSYGVILGLARLKTGSVFVPIIMHAVLNLVSTLQTAF